MASDADVAYTDDDGDRDYYGESSHNITFDQSDHDNLDYAADAVRALDDYNDNELNAVESGAGETDSSSTDGAGIKVSKPNQCQQKQNQQSQPLALATTTGSGRALMQIHAKRRNSNAVTKTQKNLHAAAAAAAAAAANIGRWTMPGSTFPAKPSSIVQTSDDEIATECKDNPQSKRKKHVNFDAAAAGDSDDSTLKAAAITWRDGNRSATEDDFDPDDSDHQLAENFNSRLTRLGPPREAAKKTKSASSTKKVLLPARYTAKTKSSENSSHKTLLGNFNADLGLRLPIISSANSTSTLSNNSHSAAVVQKFLSATKIAASSTATPAAAASLDDLPVCARCELLDKIHEQTVEALQQQVRELKDKNGRLTQLVDEQTYRLDKLEKEKQKFDENQHDILLGLNSGGGSGGSNSTNSQELLNIKAMELSRKNRELTARLESMKNKYESALRRVEALEHELGENEDAKAKREKLSNDPDALARLEDEYKTIEQKYTAAKEKAALMSNAQQMLKSQVKRLTTLLKRELGPDCDFRTLMQDSSAVAMQQWQGRDEQIRVLKAKVDQQRKHIEDLAHQKFSLLHNQSSTTGADDDGSTVAATDSGHHRLHTGAGGSLLSVGADARNKKHVQQLEKERRAQQEKSLIDFNALQSKADDYKRKWQNEKSRNEYLNQQTQLLVQTNRQLTQAFEKDEKIIQQLNEDLQTTKKRARQLQRDESESLWKMQRRIEQIERQTQLDMMQQQQQQLVSQPQSSPTTLEAALQPTCYTPQQQQSAASNNNVPWDAEFAGLKRQMNEFVELAGPLKKLYSDLVTNSGVNSPLGSSTNIITNSTEPQPHNALIANSQKSRKVDARHTDNPGTVNSAKTAATIAQQQRTLLPRADNSLLEELTFVRDENAQLSRSLKDVLERLQQQTQSCLPPANILASGSVGDGAAGDIPVQVATNYAESIAASSINSGKISRIHRIHGLANTNKWAGVKSKLPSVAIVTKKQQSATTFQQLPQALAHASSSSAMLHQS